jgi:hypothetical protein
MARSRKRVSMAAGDNSGLGGDLGDLMRALKALVDPYRPERHYMRGPGPKWRAKNESILAEPVDDHPALARVKG